jgi:hypothetical protein
MRTLQGEQIERLPAWITRVTQDLSYSPVYDAVFWNPPKKYVFKNRPPPRPLSVRVYEAHGIPLNPNFLTDQWESLPASTALEHIQNSQPMSSLESRN